MLRGGGPPYEIAGFTHRVRNSGLITSSPKHTNPPPNKHTGGECFQIAPLLLRERHRKRWVISPFWKHLRDGCGAIWQATAVGCRLEEPTGGRHFPGSAAVTSRFPHRAIFTTFSAAAQRGCLNFCTNYRLPLAAIHGAEVSGS